MGEPVTPSLSAAEITQILREGVALHQRGALDAAARCYARVLAARPRNGDALNLSGVIALQRGDAPGAVRLIGAAVAADPYFADAQANLGHALRACGRLPEALAAYDRALALQPGQLAALTHRAATRRELGDFAGAADDFDRAVALDPALPVPRGQGAADRARICDWSRHEADLATLRASLVPGQLPPPSLATLAQFDDPELHLRLGERLAPPAMAAPSFPPPGAGPIRVGYFSGDFGDHAVSRLVAELIELHDRRRFAVSAFAWGPLRTGAMRQRLEAAFDCFTDVAALDDAALAALVRERQIDIAIDLTGYTEAGRPGLFARRIAPVQVNFLGYPGTLGASWSDYIVADPVVVPAGSERFFREQVVRLPGCYQPNDRRREIAARAPTREAAGLPEAAFILACFNQPYKIGPDLFAGWMELLRAVPGSVLWLLGGLPQAQANLRAAAERQGIAAERLVFAPHLSPAEHLARHRLADLALDSAPYNGHTTTSDALWAGLPVVTFAGQSFAARVAASQLRAVGLPELVAGSRADYLALALALARDPVRLADIKARLAQNRDTAPLFDTPAYARAFEAALGTMHERRRAGLAPAGFTVPAQHATVRARGPRPPAAREWPPA